ncbi:hypothetical protein VTJ04DRAFT_6775 [Mycothermus thermophilus]|uniref:uncharacterized protein n=1 Tax=Humicola insolens TaxID=85995 RepID=UPI003743061F
MSRVMPLPQPPPLLLTKRVTAFLRANLSEHIHSAMLTTPSGSLLAHASPLPATALRRQAAVAASLWDLQSSAHPQPPANPADHAAAEPANNNNNNNNGIQQQDAPTVVRSRKSARRGQPTVTVQLDTGAVFVIRRLKCGMLFICMGGTEGSATGAGISQGTTGTGGGEGAGSSTTEQTAATADPSVAPLITSRSSRPTTPPSQSQQQYQQKISTTGPSSTTENNTTTGSQQQPTSSLILPGQAPPPPATPVHHHHHHQQHQQHLDNPHNSPSQSSILSTGAASTTSTLPGGSGVSLMRRQVEELARWLDERLSGLYVPEEGIGVGVVPPHQQQQQGYAGV